MRKCGAFMQLAEWCRVLDCWPNQGTIAQTLIAVFRQAFWFVSARVNVRHAGSIAFAVFGEPFAHHATVSQVPHTSSWSLVGPCTLNSLRQMLNPRDFQRVQAAGRQAAAPVRQLSEVDRLACWIEFKGWLPCQAYSSSKDTNGRPETMIVSHEWIKALGVMEERGCVDFLVASRAMQMPGWRRSEWLGREDCRDGSLGRRSRSPFHFVRWCLLVRRRPWPKRATLQQR